MFDNLSIRLEGIVKRLRGKGRLTEADVDDIMREIRTALLEADVNVGVTRDVVARIRAEAIGATRSQALDPSQQVVKIVNAELTRILGGQTLKITFAGRPPTVVLMAGLQGSGKTTNAAKLARWFKAQGRQPLLVGADLQRPAAVEQLRTLGGQIDVPVFSEPGDPVMTAAKGLAEARRLGRDVLIVDTAGRLAIDTEMMEQVRMISGVVAPHYTFLVIDAMTGQDAVGVAEVFNNTLAIDGVILSKLDGDARGGAALSVKEVIGKPIAFASTGEKLDAFEQFHPDRMAGRILGMGDVLTLIEQAEQAFEKDQAEEAASKLMEGAFTLDDFLEQMQQLKKMGPLGNLLGMMPGMPKELKGAEIGDDDLKPVEAIIRSMTPEERATPQLINGSRRTRIANGSGTTPSDVNRLVKQFSEMQKMMKRFGMMGKGKKGKRGAARPGARRRLPGPRRADRRRRRPPPALTAGAGFFGVSLPRSGSDERQKRDAWPTAIGSRAANLSRSFWHPPKKVLLHGSEAASHPGRQDQAAAIPHRRGRLAVAARRALHRDRRPLQPAHRPLEPDGRQRQGREMAAAGCPADRPRAQAARDLGCARAVHGEQAGQGHFMSDADEAVSDTAEAADESGAPTAAAVLTHIVTSIVDDPAAVKVEATESRGRVRLDVRVGPGDLGRVIGRRGRTAQSIRTVVRAAAVRDETDVDIEFLDD